ncbi:protein of unknown function DUF956 [Lancefieldella parvula DSM 20469]|uniref:DUF956 family protein n=1 Tax=Lancefieldella parvula (strain ATCC 33793 / DSM 20469 / CCUG 32760 / JCM 10300 / KCTC 3663 / VPI 0546 / 1246) TaxID=521095 RepID=C8W9W0_LANP1|nr:DUF956 family protein [Lancefieldella parvula]ACV50898.1 protein of unknown function DUF956 [Lancefieldella parvula DSM 20469]
MAQSQNSTVDLSMKATSFHGLATYGDILIGNKAFEFYNQKNPEDYIQIPWDQIDHIAASVIGRNKSISRFAIFTKSNGNYSFSTRDNKATLRAIRVYVGEEKLVRSPNFWFVFKHGLMTIPQIPRLIQEAFIKKK